MNDFKKQYRRTFVINIKYRRWQNYTSRLKSIFRPSAFQTLLILVYLYNNLVSDQSVWLYLESDNFQPPKPRFVLVTKNQHFCVKQPCLCHFIKWQNQLFYRSYFYYLPSSSPAAIANNSRLRQQPVRAVTPVHRWHWPSRRATSRLRFNARSSSVTTTICPTVRVTSYASSVKPFTKRVPVVFTFHSNFKHAIGHETSNALKVKKKFYPSFCVIRSRPLCLKLLVNLFFLTCEKCRKIRECIEFDWTAKVVRPLSINFRLYLIDNH